MPRVDFQLRTTILVAALAACVACGAEHPAGQPSGGGASSTAGGQGPTGTTGGTDNVAPGTAGSVSVGTGGAAAVLALPNGAKPIARLHRLTTAEFQHSLQDLLGEGVPLGPTDPDSVVSGFASIGASAVSVSPSGVGQYEDAARAATTFVFADPARITAQLGCSPASATDAACIGKIVTSFGRRAFRRPLTDAETQRFTALATGIAGEAGSDALTGVRHALNAILQSPTFLYRVELGAPSAADGGRLKYSDFEMASRLAATLWNSVPDDGLLDAAAAGSLATPEGVKAQAERLLADPKAHRALRAFGDELFGVRHLEEATKDTTLFTTWNDSLKEAMREELALRLEDVVFTQKSDFLALYDSRTTFVNNDLARFYGLPEGSANGFFKAEFPPESHRAGLLGAGAILAGHALPQRTSPTSRGKFVAESLLCTIVPPPPNMVPPLPPQAGSDATLRERLTLHREAAACRGCHALMDPMGFGMEDFDAVGLYRTQDNDKPIDATGDLTGDGLDGSTFNGLAELGAALRKQPILAPCLVSQLFAEAQGRPSIELDRGQLNELTAGFTGSQNRLDQLLLALVASDGFRFVEPKG